MDASAAAAAFARERAAAEHPGLRIESTPGARPPAVLLLSHVLGELSPTQRDEVVALARTAQCVAWIEPGERSTSRALGAVREVLRDAFEIVAPCTHAGPCPLLAAGREHDWCHFFARPPREVFTDSGWARFGKGIGIDLRSLPYSCLVLRRKPAVAAAVTAAPGHDLQRVLGRPRPQKGRALLDVCGAAGCRELFVLARDAGAEFERLSDAAGECLLYALEIEGQRIRRLQRATDGGSAR